MTAGFYRNVFNPTTGEYELIREDDETEGLVMPDIDEKLVCNNDKCLLDILHKAKGVLNCVETQVAPSGNGQPINAGQGVQDDAPWYGNWSGKAFVEKCRHEPTPAFKVPKVDVTYYGGSEQKVFEYQFDGLVVNLLNNTEFIKPTPQMRSTGDWAKNLKEFVHRYSPVENFITIAWPDYGTPPVYPGFFRALHEEVVKQGIKKVLFYCVGGHGRTGTALSSVLIEVCGYTPKEAVEWVREKYCKEAVESESQKSFLVELYKEIHPDEGTDPGDDNSALCKNETETK